MPDASALTLSPALVPSSLPSLLAWHCRRHPLMQAQDIYKLVHQGVFGPGHIIASAARARRTLTDELSALEVERPEYKVQSLVEPIDPDGRLLRVNLRPLARRCKGQSARTKVQDAEWLVEALVASARRVTGDARLMKRRLAAAVRWSRANLPRVTERLDRIAAEAAASGYPACHHSPAYSRAYRPAYRVILRAAFGKVNCE